MQLGSCGSDGSVCGVQLGGGTAASGAPSVLNSTPAEPVVSFEMTVLLTNTHLQRILHRDAAAVPSRDVVGDDVVLHRHVVPATRQQRERDDILAVHHLQAQAAATAALGAVAHDQVAVDHQVATGPFGQARRAVTFALAFPHSTPLASVRSGEAPRTPRPPPCTGMVGLWLWLNTIQLFLIVPLLMKPAVRHSAGVAGTQVAAHPVVIDHVAVGAGAESDAAGRRWRARIQGVSDRRVAGDHVVVHFHVPVEAVPDLQVPPGPWRIPDARAAADWRVTDDERIRELAVADGDAAGQRAVVGADARVGDFQVVVPAVRADRAAALRAVDHGDAVDARRVAQEVAGAVVASVRLRGAGGAVGRAGGEVLIPRREAAGGAGTPEVGAVGRNANAAGEHGDAGTLIGAHQRGLLQHLREVAVAGRVPADDRLERNAVDPLLHARRTRVSGPGRVEAWRRWEGAVGQERATVKRQSEQAVRLATPRVQLAGGMRVGIDRDRLGAHALQADRLPHQHVLLVRARGDDDQVARRRVVDRRLQRARQDAAEGRVVAWAGRGDDSRHLAADGHGDRVDRFLAVGCRDHELAALRAGLAALLDRAGRHAVWHRSRDRRVAPRPYVDHRHATDRHVRAVAGRRTRRRPRAEAVVPRDELVVERRRGRIRSRVRVV